MKRKLTKQSEGEEGENMKYLYGGTTAVALYIDNERIEVGGRRGLEIELKRKLTEEEEKKYGLTLVEEDKIKKKPKGEN